MKIREFITNKEFSKLILSGDVKSGVTYCIEETGYEYELSTDGAIRIVGSWRL